MNNRWFLSELLECGVLDVEYLEDILKICTQNGLEIDVQEVISTYGSMNINNFILEALYQLAEGFLRTHKEKIEEILNIADFDIYREEKDIYETFVNYLDSHIWFKDEKIHTLYENSPYYI